MSSLEPITRQVQAILRRHHTRDPFRIADELGVKVKFTDHLFQLKGMYTVINGCRFIILNQKNSEAMNRIVCAHELGHDQLHREYAKDTVLQEFMLYEMSSRLEYEANIFAADLLLDGETILDLIEEGLDAAQIAAATYTDINLVALKVDSLIQNGYRLKKQDHNSTFLK